MMATRHPWRALSALLVILALVAAACGGSDDDEPAAEPPAEEPTDEPAEPADEPTEPAEEPGDEPADEPAGPVETVRIGVAYADLAAFATLNPDFGIGDPIEQAEAVVDGWRRDGRLPAGIDVELVFAGYNIIGDSEKLGACTSLAQDEDVFAAIGGRDFNVGAECLATRFETPVVDTNSAPPSLYQRAAPWYFSLRPDQATQLRSFADWAHDNGYLEGKTIGLFYENRLDEAVPVMKERLSELGYEIASELSTSGEGVGSSEDQISVQRFMADDVDLVLPLIGGSSQINMQAFAEEQGFRPDYLDLDYAEHTTDIAAAPLPVEQYDGTPALTMTSAGEVAASGSLTPQAEACMANYERYSGKEIPREAPENGEFTNILLTCDLLEIVLAGLTGAADDLTRENFVAAIESAGEFSFASAGDGSFGPDDHAGTDVYRTIEWDASCPCWVATSDWEPLSRG